MQTSMRPRESARVYFFTEALAEFQHVNCTDSTNLGCQESCMLC